jgi:Txe/YoeB family toxin of Txe-Axe toxin-antitoxin module
MKQKLKLLLALSLAGILLLGCQEDKELTNDSFYQENGKIMHKTFEDLIQETQFKVAFEKMNQPKKGNSHKGNSTSKTVMEHRYGFTIVNYPASVVTSNGVASYTFLITRDSLAKNVFENLVINLKENQEPKAYLYKYESDIDIKNLDHNLSNLRGTRYITEIVYNVTQTNSLLDAGPCIVSQEWYCGGPGNHREPTAGCGGHYVSTISCSTTSGSSTYGGSFNATSGNIGYTGSTTGTGSNGGTSGPTVVTVPVAPQFLPTIEPCEKIKAKTNAQFMLNFNNINTPTYLNSGLETGFVEKKQYGVMQYVFIPGNPNGSSMNPPAGSVSFTHVHPNKPNTDENGTSIDGTVKMLSPKDLEYLITKCRTAALAEGLTPQDAQAVMISNEGIFSLSITDANIDFSFVQDNWGKFKEDYNRIAKDILSETSLTPLQRSEKLQEMMLNLLDNLGLANNISLFEGTVTPNPTGNALNWTQKKLSTDKKNKKVIPNPC